MCAPFLERRLADVVVLFVLGDREADAGFEWVDLVVELVAGEDEITSPAAITASQSSGASFGWQNSS
jgi:hypothetical protein